METLPTSPAPTAVAGSATAALPPPGKTAGPVDGADPFAEALARELALAPVPLEMLASEAQPVSVEAHEPEGEPAPEGPVPAETLLLLGPAGWITPPPGQPSDVHPAEAPTLGLPQPVSTDGNLPEAGEAGPRVALVVGPSAEPGPPREPATAVYLASGPTLVPELPRVAMPVTAPVGAPRFAHEFSQQVVWLATHDFQLAELRLDPPELGPVRVVIHVHDAEATAAFSALHPLTRDAIEAALPRLRDMLAEAGIQLSGVTVSAEGFGGEREYAAQRSALSQLPSGGTPAESGSAAGMPARRLQGLVDLFA